MLRRRTFLTGIGASAALAAMPRPSRAAGKGGDAALLHLLDAVAADPTREALAALRRFDPAGLSPVRRIDRAAVIAGLERDLRLKAAGSEPDYALLLERQFGANIAPEEAHRRLEARAQGLAAEADRLLAAEGYRTGSVGSRFRPFFAEPRWLYSDDDAGRDRAVKDMNRWLDAMRARLPALFGPLPPQVLRVAAQRMTRADEESGRSGYRTPPSAGVEGAYFVDLHQIRRRPSWTFPSVVHHELLPGHMIQIPLQDRAAPHPLRLRYAPAFNEGWAIYAEQLAADAGAFASDRPAMLGYLHWMLFRVCRGLMDTGLHVRRWPVEKVAQRVEELQGPPVIFTSVQKDIDHVLHRPGIRAAEALTWCGLARLRQRADGGKVGSAGTRAFHDAVLRNGAMPFDLVTAAAGALDK